VSLDGLASSTRSDWPFHLVRLSLATPARTGTRAAVSSTPAQEGFGGEGGVQTEVFSMGLTSTKAKLVPAPTKITRIKCQSRFIVKSK
jgi:hypothetical protein